ncbi:MAG: hypothetical protein QOE05_3302, partial [Actinomycetota bacterium]|nr:hypothetical protein [Actinomycetota bacterium]
MRLVSFGLPGAEQPGVLLEDEVVPLVGWLADLGLDGVGMNGVLGLLPTMRSEIEKYVAAARTRVRLET